MFVKYLYWDSRYDEWVPISRLAPLHFHTYTENGTLKVGQRVEVLDEIKVWREAFVMDETDTQVRMPDYRKSVFCCPANERWQRNLSGAAIFR